MQEWREAVAPAAAWPVSAVRKILFSRAPAAASARGRGSLPLRAESLQERPFAEAAARRHRPRAEAVHQHVCGPGLDDIEAVARVSLADDVSPGGHGEPDHPSGQGLERRHVERFEARGTQCTIAAL